MTEEMVEMVESRVEGVCILRVKGRLDANSSPQSEKTLFDFINKGDYKILLDFSQVDYISSAGMRMLLSTAKKLKSLSGRLVLCHISAGVMDVFKMSGFDHVLELVKSEAEGLNRLK